MTDLFTTFEESFANIWQSIVSRLPHLLVAFVTFLLFLVVGRLLTSVVMGLGARAGANASLLELFSRLSRFLISVLGVFVAATIVFPAFRPGDLVAGLGLTTVAVGFAFKDILQNFFAGILILWRNPFRVGDEIQFGEIQGRVVEINSRSTRIRTFDGELAIIPNGDIYTGIVMVKTAYEIRRVKLVVGIGYGDSIEGARSAIFHVLERNQHVVDDPGPWVYVSELAPSSVDLTVYFWTASSQKNVLQVSDEVVTEVKRTLDEKGIDIPYPHVVVLSKEVAPEPA